MKKRFVSTLTLIIVAAVLLVSCSSQDEGNEENAGAEEVILATTTSTQDSGLLDVLEPLFEEQSGYNLKIIAVGTGKALNMGREGNADVLLVHAPASEQELVDEGIGVNYRLVMHNDFVIVGPGSDPAAIGGMYDASAALAKIATVETLFISRGDDSGTNKKELILWDEAGIIPEGQWYQETGEGMGQTLTQASEKSAYTLTDRATYLNLRPNLNLVIMVEGDPSLKNIYHVMQVNPEKFPLVNGPGSEAFVEFMVSPQTQQIIGEYGADEFGQPLFFPDAG